jgi:hypothetical protein
LPVDADAEGSLSLGVLPWKIRFAGFDETRERIDLAGMSRGGVIAQSLSWMCLLLYCGNP